MYINIVTRTNVYMHMKMKIKKNTVTTSQTRQNIKTIM